MQFQGTGNIASALLALEAALHKAFKESL